MFIIDQAANDSCTLKEFSVTGSTYAPDGEVWVSSVLQDENYASMMKWIIKKECF